MDNRAVGIQADSTSLTDFGTLLSGVAYRGDRLRGRRGTTENYLYDLYVGGTLLIEYTGAGTVTSA